jgi:hypothetical protein
MAFTGSKGNILEALKKARTLAWMGQDVSHIPKGPDLINNEALSAINYAGTAAVDLIKLNTSDVIEIPGAAKVSGALEVTGALTLGGGAQVTGNSKVTGDFEVTGAITLTGAITATAGIAGGLPITGLISFNTMTTPVAGSGSTSGSLLTAGTAGTWLAHSYAGACGIKLLLANTSATGNFASLRVRARSDVATSTPNTCTVAGDFAASANIHEYGELVAVSAYAQDNANDQARNSHWSIGLKTCMQCSGVSLGSRYSLQVTDYSATKANVAQYLARFDKPSGACVIDGVFTFHNIDQFTYFANFADAGGCLSASSIALLVKTPDGDKYIRLWATAS